MEEGFSSAYYPEVKVDPLATEFPSGQEGSDYGIRMIDVMEEDLHHFSLPPPGRIEQVVDIEKMKNELSNAQRTVSEQACYIIDLEKKIADFQKKTVDQEELLMRMEKDHETDKSFMEDENATLQTLLEQERKRRMFLEQKFKSKIVFPRVGPRLTFESTSVPIIGRKDVGSSDTSQFRAINWNRKPDAGVTPGQSCLNTTRRNNEIDDDIEIIDVVESHPNRFQTKSLTNDAFRNNQARRLIGEPTVTQSASLNCARNGSLFPCRICGVTFTSGRQLQHHTNSHRASNIISLEKRRNGELTINPRQTILTRQEVRSSAVIVPLKGVPLKGVPLKGVPLKGVPLKGVPLKGVPLKGVPLKGVPLKGVPLKGVPLKGVPLKGVPLKGVPLKGVQSSARQKSTTPHLTIQPLVFRHGDRLKKFICTLCHSRFAIVSKLKTHRKQVHGIVDDKFCIGCKKCGKVFSTRKQHVRHRIVVHGTMYRNKSKGCEQNIGQSSSTISEGPTNELPSSRPPTTEKAASALAKSTASLQTMRQFKKNINVQHGVDAKSARAGWYCFCGRDFSTSVDLQEHIRLSNQDLTHNCDLCGRTFHGQISLKLHMHNFHRKRCPVTNIIAATAGQSNLSKLNISAESYNLASSTDNFQDITTQDQDDVGGEPNDEGNEQHKLVGKYPRSYHGKYLCSCGRMYVNRGSFFVHARAKNKGRIFKCSMCSKSFDLHGNLKHHVRQAHKVNYVHGRYGCGNCAQTFESSALLTRHRFYLCKYRSNNKKVDKNGNGQQMN